MILDKNILKGINNLDPEDLNEDDQLDFAEGDDPRAYIRDRNQLVTITDSAIKHMRGDRNNLPYQTSSQHMTATFKKGQQQNRRKSSEEPSSEESEYDDQEEESSEQQVSSQPND